MRRTELGPRMRALGSRAALLFLLYLPGVRVAAGAESPDPANPPDNVLRRQLDVLTEPAQRRALETLAEIPAADRPYLRVTADGALYYVDPPPPPPTPEERRAAAEEFRVPTAEPAPLDQTFRLHSLPGSRHTLFLDFDGHTTTGTVWNREKTYNQPIVSAAFDPDGNGPAFTDNEKRIIQYIWQRVAEDYAPFDVNVTTEDPGVEALRKTSSLDRRFGLRVVITPSYDWLGVVGGVAMLGSFTWSSDTPAFVVQHFLYSIKQWAECISHESGHTFNLYHMGTAADAYYSGHTSSTGGWAPIMGNSYSRNVTQWSKGEYHGANNHEDALSKIVAMVGYRADDHAGTLAGATALTVSGGTNLRGQGVIARNTDVDMFTFLAGGGLVNLAIQPSDAGENPYTAANLHLRALLYDDVGAVVAQDAPADSLRAGLSVVLPKGRYYLAVANTGVGTPLANPPTGYSTYGSVGAYSVAGTIPVYASESQPAVANLGAIVNGTWNGPATLLQGNLTTGGYASVFVCWGVTDGGTNRAAWQHVVDAGEQPQGTVTIGAEGAYFGERASFFYRFYASNSVSAAWAAQTAVFAPMRRMPDLDQTDGLVLRLDPMRLSGLVDGQQVDAWPDTSGRGNDALRPSNSSVGYPRYGEGQLNGHPVLRFAPDGSSWLAFNPIADIRTVFWVVRENAPGAHFLLGDNDQYDFHRDLSANYYFWESANGWASPNVRAGTTKLMGTVVNGTTTALGAGYRLVSLVTAGNVTASRLSRDRNHQDPKDTRSWDGDVAEILVYNRPLSSLEEQRVGGYLAAKYGLATGYTYVPPPAIVNGPLPGLTATSAVVNAVLRGQDSVYRVWAHWNTVNGGTNVAAWANAAFVGDYTNEAHADISYRIDGLASNATYFFTFRATNLSERVWASPVGAFATAGQTLSVQATAPEAFEEGGDGQFTVFRTAESTNVALTVNYTVGGTAVAGADYVALSGSVVIPAGAVSVTVNVSPIDDDLVDGDRTVTLTLAPGTYLYGTPDTATVTIRDDELAVTSQWRYKARLTFAYDAAMGPLTNFPLLVRLGPGSIPGFDYGQCAAANGADLRFLDASETRFLRYEIDRWDTNGESLVWVRSPTLNCDGSDGVWAYWGGRPGQTNPPVYSKNGAAWDPSFAGVWHLNADLRDSTSNRNHGIDVGTAATTGALGVARAFDGAGGHRIDCGAAGSLQVSGAFTVSFWMAPSAAGGDAPLVALAWPGWNGDNRDLIFNLSLRGSALRFDYGWLDGLIYAAWWGYNGYVGGDEAGQWAHVALTYASDRMYMYKNGAYVADAATAFYSLKNYGGAFHIGHWPQNSQYTGTFNGRLDEVRFEHTVRSADWIRACWLNQNPDSTFIEYGPVLRLRQRTGSILIVR